MYAVLLLIFKVIGDSGVGKSNILTQFIKKKFDPNSTTTIAMEYGSKEVTIDTKEGTKLVKAELWDTAGQERFRAITTFYYR